MKQGFVCEFNYKSNIFEQNSSFHLDRIAASGLLSRVQPANATHCEQDKYSGLTSIILKSLLPISHTYWGGGGLQISGRILNIHTALKTNIVHSE